MITMFNAMHRPRWFVRWKALIIGTALLALSACSALRLGYGQAPQLAYWWLDGYADFTSEQAPRVKAALGQWFAWHRATQLGDYADWLARQARLAEQATTPEQVCRLSDELRERFNTALSQAIPLAAPLLPGLSAAQFKHIAQRNQKALDEFRSEYAKGDAAERRSRQIKRATSRYEDFYGRLNEAQRSALADSADNSPFSADLALAERRERQAETVHALRQMAAEHIAHPDRAAAALHALAARMQRSPRAEYRAYERRVIDHQCQLVSRIHNLSSPEQRGALRAKLKGWEDDLRALAAQPANGLPLSPAPSVVAPG